MATAHALIATARQHPPPRTLTDITNLTARWVANDLNATLNNGDDVLSWPDASGNSWTATNSNSSGQRPTLLKPATGISGRSAVQNNNHPGMQISSGLSFGVHNKYTFVLVFQYTGTAPTGETGIMGIAGGLGDGFRTGMSDSNRWEYTVPSTGNFFTVSNTLLVNTWYYMIMVMDDSASPKITIYLNSATTAVAWGNAPTGITASDPFSPFHFGSSGFQNSNNQIAECMIFSQSLDATDRGVIQSYCQSTYGLP